MQPDGSERFTRAETGQSLIEIALMMPLLILLMAYSVDFGYFFIAAATVTSAARNAAEYSVQGYSSAAQGNLPSAGPSTTATSVAGTALADLVSLAQSSTKTSVYVCSKQIGTTNNLTQCSSYGAAGGGTYTPAQDPEAPTFYLNRVDVTYTVQPPIPMAFFGHSLLPSLSFHRQVSMRVMD